MSYYRVCPDCGCNIDPGEVCDCKKEAVASAATLTTASREIGIDSHFSGSDYTRYERRFQAHDERNIH